MASKRELPFPTGSAPKDHPEKRTKGDPGPLCTACHGPIAPGATVHIVCSQPQTTLRLRSGQELKFVRLASGAYKCPACDYGTPNGADIKDHYAVAHDSAAPASEAQSSAMAVDDAYSLGAPTPEVVHTDDPVAPSSTAPLPSRPADADTYTSPLLVEYGLVVNVRHRIIICRVCKTIADPRNIRNHFKEHHPDLRTPLDLQEQFRSQVLSVHPDLTFSPPFPTKRVPHIPHLEMERNRLLCSTCNRCYQDAYIFNKHKCASPKEERSATSTLAQRFLANSNSSWFPISNPVLSTAPIEGAWEAYQRQRAARVPPEKPEAQMDEYRILHQFLQRERWIQHIRDSGQTHETLMELVSVLPRHPTCLLLLKLVHSFLSKVQQKIHSMFLRRLIGTRPAVEHQTSYTRHHSEVSDPTLRKYARALVGLMYMIHTSSSSSYQLPISPDIRKRVVDLFQSVSSSPGAAVSVDEEEGSKDVVLDEDGEPLEDTEEPENPSDFGESGSALLDSCESALANFLLLLFSETPHSNTQGLFPSCIHHYILLSSLRPDQSWASASVITQKIAAILFIGRSTFGHFIRLRAERLNVTVHAAYEHFQGYLAESQEAAMPSLYLLLRGLSSISTAEQNLLTFTTPDWNTEAITIDGRDLYYHQIVTAVEQLEANISRSMDRLLFHSEAFQLPPNLRIYDTPLKTTARYSFADDEANFWMKPEYRSVLQFIIETPHIFERFGYLNAQGEVVWLRASIAEYIAHMFSLQRLIIIAICLTYGEPARGTEFASHILRNYPGGTVRNIFFAMDTFFLRGSYNKTSHFSGHDKVMARAPLPSVARLFLRFIIFLRPLFLEWQTVLRPHMQSNAFYMAFVGLTRPLRSTDVSRMLQDFTEDQFGISIPLSVHRQVMAFITSRHRELFPTHVSSAATDEQLGHSSAVDRAHYAKDANLPPASDYDSLKTQLEVSGIIHMVLGFGNELYTATQALQARTHELKREMMEIKYSNAPPLVMPPSNQPYHPSLTSSDIARRLLPYISREFEEKINQSHASVVHLFAPDIVTAESTYLSPQIVTQVHPYLLSKLREFLGKSESSLGFTNIQQAQATQLIYDGARSFALVMPTGSGKTLPRLIATKYFDQGKTTLWILPLNVMHEQYKTLARDAGITFATWTSNLSHLNAPQMLTVTINATESPRFHEFTTQLSGERKLARIIIDESHLLLTHDDFRPVMETLTWAGQTAIQIVMLTATLPPTLQRPLFEKVGVTAPLLLRLSTPRPNISFQAVMLSDEERIEDKVEDVYNKALANGSGRIIVFCQSKSLANTLGERLSIPVCHADIPQDQLNSILSAFRAGSRRALAASCILGVGLNVPAVTHVIHAGLPKDVISFAQEVGRLGRDESTTHAWSIVISQRKQPRQVEDDRFGSRLIYDWFLNTTECRRVPIQTFLDGKGIPCCMLTPDVHLCDVCESRKLEPPGANTTVPHRSINLPVGPRARIQAPTARTNAPLQVAAQHSKQVHAIWQDLPHSRAFRLAHLISEHYKFKCIACSARNHDDQHLWTDCRSTPSPYTAGETWRAWRNALHFEAGTCYQCGLPQNAKYTDPVTSKPVFIHDFNTDSTQLGHCEYASSLLPIAFISHHDETLNRSVCQSQLRKGIPHDSNTNPFDTWITESEGGLPKG